MKKVTAGIGTVIAIILVVCLVPLKTVAYEVTVDYEDIETYYEDEPYELTETYYEDEPYEVTETYYEDEPYEVRESYVDDVSVQMEILEHHLERDLLLFVRGKVKNTGDQTLHWTDVPIWVEYEIEDLPGRTFRQPGGIDPTPATFKPGEIRDFEVLVQDGTTSYEVTPPTTTKTVEGERTVTKYRQVEKQRTVTQYRQVEQERTVTKYRQVEKQRTVTKQREETRYKRVTLLEHLLHHY
jgi:hypothetical protein